MKKPLPAFYVGTTYPDSVLWIGADGVVINGFWKASFNADRSEAWCDWSKKLDLKPGERKESEHAVWAAAAPSKGDYNEVINAFLESRKKTPAVHS